MFETLTSMGGFTIFSKLPMQSQTLSEHKKNCSQQQEKSNFYRC